MRKYCWKMFLIKWKYICCKLYSWQQSYVFVLRHESLRTASPHNNTGKFYIESFCTTNAEKLFSIRLCVYFTRLVKRRFVLLFCSINVCICIYIQLLRDIYQIVVSVFSNGNSIFSENQPYNWKMSNRKHISQFPHKYEYYF